MKAAHVLFALVAVGLPAGAYAYSRSRPAVRPPPEPPPLPPPEPAAVGFVPPEPDPGPVGASSDGAQITGGDLFVQGGKMLLGNTVGATIQLGLKSLELQENLVGALGANEATKDAVRVFGHTATVGFLAQQGLEKAAEAVGLDKKTAKDIGQVGGISAAAGLVLGAPAVVGVAGIKLAAEGISAAIGAIAGKETEQAVRGFVSEADPFKTGSAANQLLAGVGNAIFGERPKEPPPAPPPLTPEQIELLRRQTQNTAKAKAAAIENLEETLERKGRAGAKGRDF